MRKDVSGSPWIIIIGTLLTVILFGSFMVWWREYSLTNATLSFRIFVWSLVVSVVFLLITRVLRERYGKR
jgi:hypothetical protein